MTEDEELELKVRRILSAEVEQHRSFLQTQFKYLTWGIGVIIAAGAIIFTYLFGKSIDESKEQLVSTIDSKVVDYRIVESFQNRLQEFIEIAVQNAVEADSTQKKIDAVVDASTDKYIRGVSEEIDKRLSTLVAEEVAGAQGLDTAELVEKVALPRGTVLAFKRTECPQGWALFEPAVGRTIIGVGSSEGLTTRALLEQGGAETHTLTITEIPPHTHRGNVSTGGYSFEHHQSNARLPGQNWQPQSGATGGGEAHNNMQPYVALRICEKT